MLINKFKVHGSVHRKNILIYIQQDAMLHNLFYLETALHVSGGTTTHHQQRKQLYLQHLVFVRRFLLLATVHTAMLYVIQFYSQAVCKPVWHIPLLCVQWKTPDDGQRDCPKQVVFHSKNKFEKFVHLANRIKLFHPDPARKLSAKLYDIYHCCV